MRAPFSKGLRALLVAFALSIPAILSSALRDVEGSGQIAYDHHRAMVAHYQNEEWEELANRSFCLIQDCSDTPFARDAHYYLGFACLRLGDYTWADRYFSHYLRENLAPKFFDRVMQCRVEIASALGGGIKGKKGKRRAIEIYDEVIVTIPQADCAAHSLCQKGHLLLEMGDYEKSLDAYRELIRRFPKHPLAPEGYLGISTTYLKRCAKKFPDPDLLEEAKINLNRFRDRFPKEARIERAEAELSKMQEKFAKQLYEIGEFYKRRKEGKAAAIYYSTLIAQFPESAFAKRASDRLTLFGSEIDELLSREESSVAKTPSHAG